MITNGSKHLGTFESPIIHYSIFNVKNLNLMKVFSFTIFNNVLGKEGKKKFLQKKWFFVNIFYCEGFDNIKNCAKMDSYRVTFGPP
jgi:hypothetical protein